MRANKLRQAVRDGERLVGYTVTLFDPRVLEVVANSGFDFLVLDMEHSPVPIDTVSLILAQLRQNCVLVRPPSNDPILIGQVLDQGASGVIVPTVNSRAEAQSVVSACRYPPLGARSWGPRPHALADGPMAYLANDASPSIFVQIESVQALRNLDDILSTDHLDGVVVGPADLALSLGVPIGSDGVFDAAARALAQCWERGLIPGCFTPAVDQLRGWEVRGSRMTTIGSDIGGMVRGVRDAAAAVRSYRAESSGVRT